MRPRADHEFITGSDELRDWRERMPEAREVYPPRRSPRHPPRLDERDPAYASPGWDTRHLPDEILDEGRPLAEWSGHRWDMERRPYAQDMASGRGILRYYGNMGPEVGADYTDEPLRTPRGETGRVQLRHHVGKGPQSFRRDDARILEDICDLMTEDSRLDASDVDVEVHDGEVTLKGTVEDRRSKRLAEAITDRVRGVTEVHNRLRLKHRRDEEPVAERGPSGR